MGQQRHLQYIYQENFISIYLQHGHNPYLTLGIATYQNIHSSVKYISIEQFDVDSTYLFHALQQCITGRGSEIFNKQYLLFDGVTTYKILTDIQEQDAKDHAWMNFASFQVDVPLQVNNYNTNYNDPGWRVDQNLWEILPSETRRIILARRREKLRENTQVSKTPKKEGYPQHLSTTDTIVKKSDPKEP